MLPQRDLVWSGVELGPVGKLATAGVRVDLFSCEANKQADVNECFVAIRKSQTWLVGADLGSAFSFSSPQRPKPHMSSVTDKIKQETGDANNVDLP